MLWRVKNTSWALNISLAEYSSFGLNAFVCKLCTLPFCFQCCLFSLVAWALRIWLGGSSAGQTLPTFLIIVENDFYAPHTHTHSEKLYFVLVKWAKRKTIQNQMLNCVLWTVWIVNNNNVSVGTLSINLEVYKMNTSLDKRMLISADSHSCASLDNVQVIKIGATGRVLYVC